MLIMRKYGGHYKVNGPFVNVPTTLDKVIHMLPHMSDQLQLHPVKLKKETGVQEPLHVPHNMKR